MSRKWKTKDGDTSVSFDSDKKVVYVGGEFIAIDESTADNATVTNSAGESTTVDLALEFTGSKGDPNARISTLERNITILADALISGGSSNLISTVPSASKWATARTISLSGDASGSVAIDGTSNVTLSVAVNDDSHNHTIANIDGLQTALNGKLATGGKAADSNLLDGLDSSAFLRSNANDTASGIITFSNTTAATGAGTGAVRVSGGMSVSGSIYAGGDVVAYSDERLKDNIEVIADAGEKVAALRGVTFTRKSDGEASTGLIAQDVAAVLPQAVSEDEEGMLSVKYANLVGLLVEAVKELQAEVKALKGE